MSEYAKSTKTVHQVLLLTSAAVLAFSLVPNREPAFEHADTSLEKLESLTQNKWDDFVFELQRPAQELADSYVHKILLRLDPSFHPDQEPMFIFSDLHYPLVGKLAEIGYYVNSQQTLTTVTLKDDFVAIKKQWQDSTLVNPMVPGPTPERFKPHIDFASIAPNAGFTTDSASRMKIVWPSLQDRSVIIQLSLDRDSAPPGRNSVTLTTVWESSAMTRRQYALEWIKRNDPTHILLRNVNGSEELLPFIQPFWGEVNGLTIQEARQKLHTEREAQSGKVSLFGLSVDSKSTVRIMPWVLSSLLLFLTAHMRQFRKYGAASESNPGTWVGLFDDWTGRLIAGVTILVLPILASSILIARYGSQQDPWMSRWLSLPVVAAMSGWATVELSRLRIAIANSGNPPAGNAKPEPSGDSDEEEFLESETTEKE